MLVIIRMIQDFTFVPGCKSFRWTWAKLWNSSSFGGGGSENYQITPFCWPNQRLTPPQSWPTSLPSLSSCLAATQSPVCAALHNEHIVFKPSTWISTMWTRFHPALPINTSAAFTFSPDPSAVRGSVRFHADLFDPLHRPKRSHCPGPHAMQHFPLERALWKWRKFSAEMLWFHLPPPHPEIRRNLISIRYCLLWQHRVKYAHIRQK